MLSLYTVMYDSNFNQLIENSKTFSIEWRAFSSGERFGVLDLIRHNLARIELTLLILVLASKPHL